MKPKFKKILYSSIRFSQFFISCTFNTYYLLNLNYKVTHLNDVDKTMSKFYFFFVKQV